MKLLKAEAGVNDGKAGLLSAAGLFAKGGIFDKKSESFNIHELDPYLLFDAQSSMLGTLEAETLDLDPATPSTLDVITATRAGVATFTEPDGTIATAPSDTVRVDHTQGAELTPTKYQQLEQTDFSLWAHARTSGTANAAISPDGQNNATYVEQNAGQAHAGSIYRSDAAVTGVFTLSVYAKKKEKDFVVLYDTNTNRTYFNLDTGTVGTVPSGNTANIEDAGNGWFRCSTTFTASSGTVKAFYVGDNDNSLTVTDGGGIYVWGPQFEEGTTASSFVANTTGSPLWIASPTFGPRVAMILVEPSATNLFTYSEDATQWTGSNRTVTPNTTTAPDGNQTAATIVRTAGSGDVRGTIQSVSAGLDYSLSIFAKADTDALIKLDVSNSVFGSGDVTFNARTGEQTAGDTTKASVEVFPNGWRRFVFTPTCAVTGTSSTIIRLENDEPVQLWGFQFEEGSVTSYIPTSGGDAAARTRAADDLVISGSDFTDFFNASEGTVYAEFVPKRNDDYRHVYEFSNGTTGQRINLHLVGGSVVFYSQSNGATYQYSTNTVSGATTGVLHRSAFSYKTNDAPASFDGGAEIPDTEYSVPSGINRLYLGDYTPRDGNYLLTGHIKRLIYWPTESGRL